MRYFLIESDEKLTLLAEFYFAEGTTHLIQVPLSGKTLYGQSRREPDTFRMVMSFPTKAGRFHVVDENLVVYGCMGSRTSAVSKRWIVEGVITEKHGVNTEHIAEVKRLMAVAMGA